MQFSVRSKNTKTVAVSFVDGIDLAADGELANQNTQKMTDEHDDNCAATGGHVESEKYHSWKWRWKWKLKWN